MNLKIKILISIGVVGLTIGLIIYFVIFPTVKDIQSIKQAVYLERIDLEKKYLRGQLLNKTIEDFEKIKPERSKLMSIFITAGEELEFIQNLEEVASRHSIDQVLRLQSDQSRHDFYFSFPIAATAEGQFTNILQYLRGIEHLQHYFNISEISISSGRGRAVDDPIVMSINGKMYGVSAEEKADTDKEGEL